MIAVATQDRLFSTETPTDGYQLGRVYAVVLVWSGRSGAHTHGEAGERDQRAVPESSVAHQGAGPEMGRNFKLLYNVKF